MAALLTLTGTVSAAPATGSPTNPLPLVGPVDGSLIGNSGGAYAFFQFSYPGDGSTVSLTLTTNNATPLNSGAAGLNVYQGHTTATAGRDGPFTDLALFSSTTPGPVLAQVFDYDPANNIAFTLTPQGLPVPSAAATTASSGACRDAAIAAVINRTGPKRETETGASPDYPYPLNSGAVQGSLLGKSDGAYFYYQTSALPPISSSNNGGRAFMLTTDAPQLVESGQVGLDVYYKESPLPSYMRGNPLLPETINALGWVTVNATDANGAPLLGPMLLQVFNCDAGKTVQFTLSVEVVTGEAGPGPG